MIRFPLRILWRIESWCKMKDIYIAGAVRTAIGGFMGGLKDKEAHELGTVAIKEVIKRSNIDVEKIDEVIMGNILASGQGQGPGRQASVNAGIPVEVPAWSINQLCGSGLKTVCLGANSIKAGEAECVIAGGMESMSRASHLAEFVRSGSKMGNVKLLDSMIHDGLTDAFTGEHMGVTAEWIAEKYDISRLAQDEFAFNSQQKAKFAQENNLFAEEIVGVAIPQRKKDDIIISHDEHPRHVTSMESLGKLRAAFKKDGTVTPGNASGVNDGAAAISVVSEDFLNNNNLKPFARIAGYATTGLDPKFMGLGPIEATKLALKRAGWTMDDIDLIEANEAFAVQSLAVGRELNIDPAKLNVNGGAIALGHPIGASGARILVTLLYEMQRRNLKKGLATLCVGGGMGVAVLVER